MSTKRGSTSFTFNSGCKQVPYKFCPKVYTSPVAIEEELEIILGISVDLEEPKGSPLALQDLQKSPIESRNVIPERANECQDPQAI